jgi:5-formyltetrahydrofolate cyclo-ligase
MKRDFNSDPKAAKEETRRTMRTFLRALNTSFHAEASLVICELAAQLPAFRAARCVGLFAPLASEPDIHPLIEEAWAEGKEVALPRLEPEKTTPRLDWHVVKSWSEVAGSGPFGLREPDPHRCPRLEPHRLDCLFVPGLAFDDDGLRLGRGGGYYDRFLGEAPVGLARFGLMFAGQRVARLPREPHDQALPAVITEDGIISFEKSMVGDRSIQPPPSTSSPR